MFGVLRITYKKMSIEILKPIGTDIKVLGTGCVKCKTLEKATRQAVDELQLNATIEKVEDIQKIMEFGVMRTPGLVINGKVILTGKVPKVNELKEILTQNK